MFDNSFFEPIAVGGAFHKVKESGGKFFIPCGDSEGLFDALEEILNVMAL